MPCFKSLLSHIATTLPVMCSQAEVDLESFQIPPRIGLEKRRLNRPVPQSGVGV
ncbi:unnamed protein product [Chondrus crispus]|uniref:Uncharacterized protein n=1 Tax=Chondrus crispus TaxID=2769 RepID=R7QD82_CHOCR|nr:unnamed protein product [Chondrus crispus]CDF35738.1 unnamed protein product [Chondrus crispus]|eukprot:XP_005715557.1 unnamed protein product [Chondrus crispus]